MVLHMWLLFVVQVIALGLICCGSWMHASQDVHAYLTVFSRGTYEYLLVAAAALILVAGLVLLLVSILGIFAVLRQNAQMVLAVSLRECFSPLFLVHHTTWH